MDLDLFLRLVPLAISVGSMIVALIATRRKDVDKRFENVMERIDSHGQRLQAVEGDVAAMPGKDDLHKLELILTQMGGDMKAMRAEMAGTAGSLSRIENIVGRHEDHLREKH